MHTLLLLPCLYSHTRVYTRARGHTGRAGPAREVPDSRSLYLGLRSWRSVVPQPSPAVDPAHVLEPGDGAAPAPPAPPAPPTPRTALARQAHRLISDLQMSSKSYSLALVGWKITSSWSISSGRIVPNPSLGWMSTNWQMENH